MLLPTIKHPTQGRHSTTKMSQPTDVSQPPSSVTHMLVCLHSRAKNEVTTVAGIEAMHGPNGMDSHLSMLNT